MPRCSRKGWSRSLQGYTLLELMITLTVMAGLVAVAWPRLTRPMEQSQLQQAAHIVRDAIEDCRQVAANEGRPIFLVIRSDQEEIIAGDFESILTEMGNLELPSSSRTPRAASAEVSETRALRMPSKTSASDQRILRWTIPSDVALGAVRWSSSLPSEIDPEADFDVANALESKDAIDTQMARRWVIPFLPIGPARDATIELHSVGSRKSIEVVLHSATGMIEVR